MFLLINNNQNVKFKNTDKILKSYTLCIIINNYTVYIGNRCGYLSTKTHTQCISNMVNIEQQL